MSIHQPRYSIYKLFDSLTLMSHGRLVYHGPANNTLNYFSEIGEKMIKAIIHFTKHNLPVGMCPAVVAHNYTEICLDK